MIKAGAAFYASFGYTTVQEGRAMPGSATMLAKAGEAGLLDVDVVVYPDVFQSLKEIAPSRDYKNRVRIGGAKATIDGSPQGKTAFLSQPYYKPPEGQSADYRGYAAITKQQIVDAVDLAFANGWQILTHANGDAAVDWLIEAVGDATAKHGPGDRRAVLVHGQTARLDQLPKLKELAILPSFFPMHTYYWGDWHRSSVLGPERAERISPCNSARKLGMIFTSHHDAPVANPDAIRVLSATVTRVTRSGYVLGPEERVDTLTALKAMTIWPAVQYFEEASKGTIEPGKLADFVILSDNPLAVKPEELDHAQGRRDDQGRQERLQGDLIDRSQAHGLGLRDTRVQWKGGTNERSSFDAYGDTMVHGDRGGHRRLQYGVNNSSERERRRAPVDLRAWSNHRSLRLWRGTGNADHGGRQRTAGVAIDGSRQGHRFRRHSHGRLQLPRDWRE